MLHVENIELKLFISRNHRPVSFFWADELTGTVSKDQTPAGKMNSSGSKHLRVFKHLEYLQTAALNPLFTSSNPRPIGRFQSRHFATEGALCVAFWPKKVSISPSQSAKQESFPLEELGGHQERKIRAADVQGCLTLSELRGNTPVLSLYKLTCATAQPRDKTPLPITAVMMCATAVLQLPKHDHKQVCKVAVQPLSSKVRTELMGTI